jgi:uncharacterized membrane protein (UPF0127 family)
VTRSFAVRASALVCWLVACALCACEPRIEEPTPPSANPSQPAASIATIEVPAATASPTRPSTSATAAGTSSVAPGNRCIEPTPPQPERTVTLKDKFDPKCPTDPETPPKLRAGKVIFVDAKQHAVTVEIAERGPDRQRGLMYRKSMPDDHGMIFLFEEREEHTFWMKNTCIPLDMLFIDDDGTIVGIEENTPTMTERTFSVGCPSRYVLELNAGWTRRHGVTAGQKVRLEGLKP